MPSQSSFRASEIARSRGHFNGHHLGNNAQQSGYKRSSLTTVTFALPDGEPKRKFSQNLAESTVKAEQIYHEVDEETKEEEDEEKDEEEEEKDEEEEEGVTNMEIEETALRDEVNKIIQQTPTLKSEQIHVVFDVLDFPTSYRCNSEEEKKILVYLQNFENQFFTTYPDRKPLFLCPGNECYVKKFVCTTLKPSMVCTELSSWEGAASFVSDHFVYTSLEIPDQLMRLLQYLLTLVVCHNELQARPLLYVVSWPLASSPLQNIFTKKLPQEVDINVTEVETSWLASVELCANPILPIPPRHPGLALHLHAPGRQTLHVLGQAACASEQPKQLLSPSTILLLQHANCLELSTLLTSLLLGAGYDAYVVSGYAVRETCFADESKEPYPWPEHYQEQEQKKEETWEETLKTRNCGKYGVREPSQFQSSYERMMTEQKEEGTQEEILKAHDCRKYGVRKPNQFQSSYERMMTEREATRLQKEIEKKKQEEEMRKKSELDQRYDELYGQRVHSWVLILPGCRGVGKPFFIEPSTGQRRPLTSSRYLRIESLWNHQNFWVNMQQCPNGIQSLNYDLDDTRDWESVLPFTNLQSLCTSSIYDLSSTNVRHRKEITDDDETEMKVPRSWVECLSVTRSDFQLRYPQGYKCRNFRGVRLELFAPRLMPTGLIRRLICYDDPESNSIALVVENFKHRSDKLFLRHIDLKTGWIVERFHPGHMEHFKDHKYRPRRGQRTEHHLLFYDNARADGLEEVNDCVDEFVQRFSDRSDFLHLRHVVFDGVDYDLSDQNPRRHVTNITEVYDRNIDKLSYDDISTIVYDFDHNEMSVTYHSGDEKLSNIWRKFTKPDNINELREFAPWEPDCYSAYLDHPRFKEMREFEKHRLFTDVLKAEQESMHRFLAAERHVQMMVNCLQQKDEEVVLEQTVFNFRQHNGAKNYTRELVINKMQEKSGNVKDLDENTALQNVDEKKNQEEVVGRWHQKEVKRREDRVKKEVLEDKSADYMSPFLCQLEETDVASRKMALQLRRMCLDDFKSRMVEQADFIQERYDKARDFIQKNASKYAETDLIATCRKVVLDLRVSERRLLRHKEKAPRKFSKLEKRIESDPRFAKYFARPLSHKTR